MRTLFRFINRKNKCRDCNGRGKYSQRVETPDGMAEILFMYCESCRGTGINQDPEAGDDYDIGGDSYAEDD